MATLTRTSLTAAITLLLSLALFSCGGGEGDSSTAGASQTAAAEETAPRQPGVRDSGRATPDPSPDRGVVSARSAPFRGSHGPLRHLPEYGVEATAVVRGEVQATVDAFFAAASRGDWKAVCARLTPETLLQVRRLTYGTASPPPGWCAEAFPSFLTASGHAASEFKPYDSLRVASFRVEDDAGFALINGPDGQALWLALKRPGGTWKLITPLPQPL